MLRILNLRRGFATNSSSSHSILLLPNKQFKPRQISESETGAFHGEDFTLTDSQSKQRYLSALLLNSLREMSADMKKTILSDWVSDEYAALAVDHDYQIDHDSVFYIPMDYGTKSPSKQLWDEIKTFVLRDDVVILGGYNGSHPLSEMDKGRYMYLDNVLSSSRMDGDTVCRKDPKYNFWTVFNTRNGAKIRFVLEDLLNDTDSYYFDYKDKYTKSYTPELVDMGITSWCDINCKFCYTNATVNGHHADYWHIRQALENMSQMKVFEVAFGKGEPTKHPKFAQILQDARYFNIVPNFTTRSLHWLTNDDMREEILEYAGAFAYSLGTAKAITRLNELAEKYRINKDRINIHVVMGTINQKSFSDIINTADDHDLRVTLLGYKNTRRGTEFKPIHHDWWLEVLMNRRYHVNVSIDTTLAAQYEKQIQQANVPVYTYHTQEGKFSAYWDIVDDYVAPDSYTNDPNLQHKTYLGNYDEDSFEKFLEAYQTF